MTPPGGRRPGRSLVVRCAAVLTVSGPPVRNGWIEVARGRIIAVGCGRPRVPCIDLGDAVALPGLVNAHTHLEFSDLRRPLDTTGGLPEWIRRIVALRRARPTGADGAAGVARAVAAGLAESIAEGVTSVGEIATTLAPAVVDALAAGRPRVRVFRESLGLAAPTAAAIAAVHRDLDRLAERGLAVGLSPHAPYSVSGSLGARLAELSAARRLPIAMHVAESRAEAELIAAGAGPFRDLLDQLGAWPAAAPRLLSAADWISLLARGPRGLVIHGTWLDGDRAAWSRLARHRARLALVICPRTTLALGGRLPPLHDLRAAGVRMAIGTDSRASNPDLSVRAECSTLVDAGLVSPEESLAMATVHGARAIGFDRVGSLTAGRRADVVFVRPAGRAADPVAAALDPSSPVVAVLRGGRLVAGSLPA